MKRVLPIFLILILSLPATSSVLMNYEMYTAEGDSINLQDYEDTVFIMIAMTTECSSCKLQNAHMSDVVEVNQDLNIISVAIDPKIDTVETIAEYKETNNITWTLVVDTAGELRIIYDINTYPQTFVFDETGEIVKKWIGVVSAADLIDEVGKYTEVSTIDSQTNTLVAALLDNIFFISFVVLIILIYPTYKILNRIWI